jgi:hypothetical protein
MGNAAWFYLDDDVLQLHARFSIGIRLIIGTWGGFFQPHQAALSTV